MNKAIRRTGTALSLCILVPIRLYLYYKVLILVDASELMMFLFWVYAPLALLLSIINEWLKADG